MLKCSWQLSNEEEIKNMENIFFKDMNLSNDMQKAIADMGFEEATPIQAKAIPNIMEGKDIIGLAQTGTGKTCAFGIPTIEKIDIDNHQIQALILCPTRELVIQTTEELKGLVKYKGRVKLLPVYGGQQIDRQIQGLKNKPHIIIGTPGRIMDHLRRKTIKLQDIKLLILDEADEMLNMGFREDLNTILEQANQDRQTILFSATMSKDVEKITREYQKNAITIKIEHKTLTVPQTEQYYVEVNESKKIDALTRILDASEIKLSIVFCNTKRKVDEVTSHLQTRGYLIEALHGDMRQSQRDNVMKKFRNSQVEILVATDVAARGIDVDDIEMVFNFDVPNDEEYYVHRIGRTGRAGRLGKAITLVTAREFNKLRDIERYTKANISLFKVPSSDSIIDKKIKQLFSKIKDELKDTSLPKYAEYIEKFIEEETEISTLDIATILLKLSLGEIKKDTLETNVSSSSDNSRMFINIGTMDGLTNNSLKDFLVDASKFNGSDIFNVEVLEKFSFFNIKKELAEKLISILEREKYNGRRIGVEISSNATKGNSKNLNRNRDNRSRDNGGRDKDRRSFRNKDNSYRDNRKKNY
jgi:ATP-dependent RNA helicase DeaD